ncbi:MAG: hypothetical protein AAFO79_01145 [Pseudomonadota bacterium]
MHRFTASKLWHAARILCVGAVCAIAGCSSAQYPNTASFEPLPTNLLKSEQRKVMVDEMSAEDAAIQERLKSLPSVSTAN